MRSRSCWLSCLCLVVFSSAGCVSLKRTPEARFFVLRAVAEAGAPAAQEIEGIVGVSPVRLPGHLRRPQVVTEAGPNEVLVDEFVRWAEPLAPATTRIVTANLAALLPGRLVAEAPWSAHAPLLCEVVIELDAFAPRSDGEVRLEGRWALVTPRGSEVLDRGDVRLRRGPLPVGPAGVDAAAGSEAMSELLAELAGQVAEAVTRLPERSDS